MPWTCNDYTQKHVPMLRTVQTAGSEPTKYSGSGSSWPKTGPLAIPNTGRFRSLAAHSGVRSSRECIARSGGALRAGWGLHRTAVHRGVAGRVAKIGQQLGAFVLLLPFALSAPLRAWPPVSEVVALLLLAVFSSALAYLLFFRLISSVGAAKTATVSYLIPLFGTIWAVVVLQERVGLEMLAGMLVVLCGVLLAMGTRLSSPARRLAT